jgi:hypothetical protein
MIVRLIVFIFSILPTFVLAQWSLAPALTVGFPVGEFSRNNNIVGVGLDLCLIRTLSESPVSVGVQLAYLTFGRLQSNQDIPTDLGYTINANITVNHNIAYAHGMVRFKPLWSSRVIPYADIVTGAKSIFTFTDMEGNQQQDSLNIDASFNTSWAFDLGVAGGFEINLNDVTYFNFKTTFLSGTAIRFTEDTSVRIDGANNLIFNRPKINGNLVMVHAGIRFLF